MNYKIKSSLYLIGFIAMALLYDQLSEEADSKKEVLAAESVETPKEEVIVDLDYQY